MILILGLTLGLGLLLAASPFLWPARDSIRSTPSRLGVFRDRLAQAGLGSVSLPLFGVVSVVVGLAIGAVVFAFVPVIALAVAAAVAATALPALLVNSRARKRRKLSRMLWPDVVDHLVSGVRSGLSLPDSVSSLAATGPATTRAEFASFEQDYAATGNFQLCLDRLKARLADPTADRLLETLRMAREVGGSELPAVLRSLAAYLRQESAIRGEVEARQSWVMNAAKLGAAAPWVVLVLLATRPEAAAAYNSPSSMALIVGGLLVTVIAYRLMVALARLPEERRWFA
ncbi:type II secretion system F family protein [Cryobacterium sp. BB307]|uniref:type II secretion system F family protein n=1 Tax=Cryobacterium sp. BB307 TaxID=2716317 RepID=UPI001447562C|nr:type II secretion system F family protein [Cryobacterium sp. BB307]